VNDGQWMAHLGYGLALSQAVPMGATNRLGWLHSGKPGSARRGLCRSLYKMYLIREAPKLS
jgi:hypothetical protein